MKKVVVEAWCTNHDTPVRAVAERLVSIDGSKPVVLDLCGPCDAVLMRVRDMLAEGTKPEPKKPGRKPKEVVVNALPVSDSHCPSPGCGQVLSSRAAMRQHLNRVHGESIKDYR